MIHVLFIDDEPDLLESGKKDLEESGEIFVDIALSAHAALEMLGQKPYEVIVSDFQLPDMEGITFLKKMQASVNGLPFIIFPGENTSDSTSNIPNHNDIRGNKNIKKSTSRFVGLKQNILETAKQHRTKEYYRQISENTREGIVVVQDDVIVYSNRTLIKILGGYSPEEIEGHGFTDIVHPDDSYSILRLRQERPSGNELELEYPFRVLTRNGEVRCLECREIVIEWQGQPATLSFLLDITEQKQEEKVLVLTKRKISILNELTRHDIANRLTVLRGRLKRARRITHDPQVIRQLEEVDNAGRDIFNHLEMARTYQDMGMFSPRWFNLRSILDYRKILTDAPDLKISIETGDLEIYADPLCPRVFENLIDNSLRHGNHVSEIHITSRQTEKGLVVILEDNGNGIRDEDKECIFEQGVGKHTGLGLFLCREILSITGITIRETGDAGRGARFEITVPRGAFRPNNSGQAIGMPCI